MRARKGEGERGRGSALAGLGWAGTGWAGRWRLVKCLRLPACLPLTGRSGEPCEEAGRDSSEGSDATVGQPARPHPGATGKAGFSRARCREQRERHVMGSCKRCTFDHVKGSFVAGYPITWPSARARLQRMPRKVVSSDVYQAFCDVRGQERATQRQVDREEPSLSTKSLNLSEQRPFQKKGLVRSPHRKVVH